MATVYLARDDRHARAVAVKVLRAEIADLLGRERFLREIETVARLQHPHIVPLFDSGSAADFLYYVMPAVEGETLRERLDRETHLPVEHALGIAREVADALYYAHTQGLVHRDVKPENIHLSGGHALLADFGIARLASAAGAERITETGLAVGTPAYMSPEQASASDKVDARSDVYALGCVVYEMLAGEPPFTGRTAQAVMARHLQERPPSLRVVRPTVTLAVQEAIERALEKTPADRHPTAAAFATALERAARRRLLTRRRLTGTAVVGALAVTVGVLWRFVVAPPPPLDANKVVVFPLAESPARSGPEGLGSEVALMIGSGLEHTEPLVWIDGETLLDAVTRADVTRLRQGEARRLTRRRGARWYVDGSAVRRGDSVSVVLRLNDARGDSVAGRANATRITPEAAQAGLSAMTELLPPLLAPGRRVDLSLLADRRPAAVATWLQGEREYRRSHFDAALGYFQRALAEDSALIPAALRGAQAASWLGRLGEAATLAAISARHATVLPPRHASLARGLAAYLSGDADSAVAHITNALRQAPEWAEAHFALGEVYYHLLPNAAGPLDSLAEAELVAAAAVDTGFGPPRFHLAEIAIRSGSADRARRAVRQFERFEPDPEVLGQLVLMERCALRGRDAVDWRAVAAAAPLQATQAAKALAVGGAAPGCAEDAFRALLRNAGASAYHWGAFLGLQGVLAAQGRVSELQGLIDSLVASGLDQARRLYLVDDMAGVAVEASATAAAGAARSEFGEAYRNARPTTRWLLGTWHAARGDGAAATAIQAQLVAEASRGGDAAVARLAESLAARLAALAGDSVAAIARLRRILQAGRRDLLEWDLTEPLAVDRLLLARLLLARGEAEGALVAAATFDHQGPVVFLPYLPASLALRAEAASALGLSPLAARYRERLTQLGHADRTAALQHAPPSRRKSA